LQNKIVVKVTIAVSKSKDSIRVNPLWRRISAKVTGGDGRWEDNTGYPYKKNLRISITLDEIGDDESNNNNGSNDSDDNICDSDPETTAPSCEDFEKEFQLGE
jgi:hypothetical protein